MSGEFFPDTDLVAYVTEWYGPVMGARIEDMFADDPESRTGFARSVRRSLTREIERKAALSGEALLTNRERSN